MSTASLAAALTQPRKEADRQLLDDCAAANDQGAFTALVQRHGPMV